MALGLIGEKEIGMTKWWVGKETGKEKAPRSGPTFPELELAAV